MQHVSVYCVASEAFNSQVKMMKMYRKIDDREARGKPVDQYLN